MKSIGRIGYVYTLKGMGNHSGLPTLHSRLTIIIVLEDPFKPMTENFKQTPCESTRDSIQRTLAPTPEALLVHIHAL